MLRNHDSAGGGANNSSGSAPELTEQVAALLEYVGSAVERTDSFVVEQTPLVVQDLVAFGRVYSASLLLVSVAGIVLCIVLFKTAMQKYRKFNDADFDSAEEAVLISAVVFLLCGSALLLAFSLVVFCTNLDSLTKSWFAPRLYILDYIRTML